MNRALGTVALSCLCGMTSASAQDLAGLDLGGRLGPGYAQVLNLVAVPDVSTARYAIDDGGGRLYVDVTRLPFETQLASLGESAGLFGRVLAGYVRMETDLPLRASGPGQVSTRWTALGLTGGLSVRFHLTEAWTLVPGLDAGMARLSNRTDYTGSATVLQPVFDGSLFNWDANAWILTPHLGVLWDRTLDDGGRVHAQGHAAWSHVASHGEANPALRFHEKTGVYSFRVDRTIPSGHALFARPFDWLLFASHAGFAGPNRNALGFDTVSEVGAGLEVPIGPQANMTQRLRLGASWLFGGHVHGWALSAGMRF